MEIPDDAFLITPGNSTFLNSNYSLEFRHSNFSILLKILRPQPSVRIFTGIVGSAGPVGYSRKNPKGGLRHEIFRGFKEILSGKSKRQLKKDWNFHG